MRLTRAAQRAQQSADESNDATDVKERAALNEISPNASSEQSEPVDDLPKKTPAKKAKGKASKKVAKGKKGKTTDIEGEEEEEEVIVQANCEDEHAVALTLVNDATSQGLGTGPSAGKDQDTSMGHPGCKLMRNIDIVETAVENERPATPPVKPVRLTRRQLALQEEETALKQSQQAPVLMDKAEIEKEEKTVDEPKLSKESEVAAQETVSAPKLDVEQEMPLEKELPSSEHMQVDQEEQAQCDSRSELTAVPPDDVPLIHVEEEQSDLQDLDNADTDIIPSVEAASEPEPKTLVDEQLNDDCTRTPVIDRTSSSRRASRSPSKSPMRIEESFEALDALEEALENVKSVTSFDHPIEDRSPRKKAPIRDDKETIDNAKTPSKTPLATRVSRTPNPALKSMKATTSSLARALSVRAASGKDARKPSAETSDSLASRQRPVSVSFPTPPPPPKGRAPTRAAFHLSSDEVVAKLKAQKEERLKREADNITAPKQRPISMPPPSKSSKPVTKPDFKLPGEEIAEKLKARKEERLARLQNGTSSPKHSTGRPMSMIVQPPKSTKPPTKAAFELPGAAVAEKLRIQREERLKRMEEAEAAKKEAAAKARAAPPVRKPTTLPARARPGVSIGPPPQVAQVQRSTSLASKRSSVVLSQPRSTSTSSANRNSVVIAKSIVTPDDAVAQKVKGREVFNRDKVEKDARERERREKEEAAKRARAEAAERGRIASREWAEKQRKKLLGGNV